jgi:hypothetical protein
MQLGSILDNIGMEKGGISILNPSNIESSSNGKFRDVFSNKLENKGAPYSFLADQNNQITYRGVTFTCDNEHRALCLGNMAQTDNILTIYLSEGGCLKVNRDNINDLGKAIGMFSPEDVKRILDAIALDAKIHKKDNEIDKQEKEVWDTISEKNTEQNTIQ